MEENEEKENIKVVIRFRPLLQRENKLADFKIDNNSIFLREGKTVHNFTFDFIFDSSASQEYVFDKVAKESVISSVQGYNTTIFAYGPTSSGKTFCMFGTKEKMGIIPRVCQLLFDLVEQNDNVKNAQLRCSFLEIYMENIRDLLSNSEENLKIRQDYIRGVYVQSLTEKEVESPIEIIDIIKKGIENRSISSTNLNQSSSRSHSVFTICLSQELTDGNHLHSKLNLVDLAGSENVAKSEATGTVLVEAQKINKSLSCLANVIYALTEPKRVHIPYRDSKLTYLLQDSMGGKSKTILIITASPSQDTYFETLNSLKFGNRAKTIKNSPRINKTESFGNLKMIIKDLRDKLRNITEKYEELKNSSQYSSSEELCKIRCTRLEKKIDILENSIREKNEIEKELHDLIDSQKEYMDSIICKYDAERQKVRDLENTLFKYRILFKNLENSNSEQELLAFLRNFSS